MFHCQARQKLTTPVALSRVYRPCLLCTPHTTSARTRCRIVGELCLLDQTEERSTTNDVVRQATGPQGSW